MKVLVAGATGAIGHQLLPQLRAAGHEVTAFTRTEARTSLLEAAGASAVVCDAFDVDAVRRMFEDVRPDAVIDQLTSLPQDPNPRKLADSYAANDRVRREGSGNLIEAAKANGVARYVIQSVAFLYAPTGSPVKTEQDAPWIDAPEPFDDSVAVLLENERKVTEATEFTGIALRYGFFYGPGTWYASDGSMAKLLKARKFPIVGGGGGINSFVHVSDAAAATVAALERGDAGVYNIVDDSPAPGHDWIPYLAEQLGGKPPRRLPAWFARLAVGKLIASQATVLRGADNEKAKAKLGFSPAIPDWRVGMRDYRDSVPSS